MLLTSSIFIEQSPLKFCGLIFKDILLNDLDLEIIALKRLLFSSYLTYALILKKMSCLPQSMLKLGNLVHRSFSNMPNFRNAQFSEIIYLIFTLIDLHEIKFTWNMIYIWSI